jgi:hypothetical protein
MWIAVSGQVPGSGHVERGIPCQDRADSWVGVRPGLMVLDGRGSAALSHVGAAAARETLRSFIRDSEPLLAQVLDTPDEALAAVGWQGLARMMFHAAACKQLMLAEWYQTDAGSFEFTLTLAIVGVRRLGWFAVGDSPLVIGRHGVTALATGIESHEFANQTSFVTASPSSRLGMQGGLVPLDGVRAIIAMTDGTASRMVKLRDQTPATAVSQLAERFATRQWDETDLIAVLEDPAWDEITRDDRSLGILARDLPFPPLSAEAAVREACIGGDAPTASGTSHPAMGRGSKRAFRKVLSRDHRIRPSASSQ